jgi:hypothetical protein
MSYIIRSKRKPDPFIGSAFDDRPFAIPIAGTKSIKSFPSGLVLVSQQYAVPKGYEGVAVPKGYEGAGEFRVGNLLKISSPAVDGLYIFPEPEWRDSGDGFTRITVSAYGRSRLQPQIETSFILGTYRFYDLFYGTAYYAGTRQSTNGVYTVRKVIPSSVPPPLSPPQITTPYVAPYGGVPFVESGSVALSLIRSNTTTTNFGNWTEVVDTYIADAKYYYNSAQGGQPPAQ